MPRAAHLPDAKILKNKPPPHALIDDFTPPARASAAPSRTNTPKGKGRAINASPRVLSKLNSPSTRIGETPTCDVGYLSVIRRLPVGCMSVSVGSKPGNLAITRCKTIAYEELPSPNDP